MRDCRDCGSSFTLTTGEIDFYAARGLVPPKRCAACLRREMASSPDARSARGLVATLCLVSRDYVAADSEHDGR
jgi:Probable zinc-ribbon domain